jgi:hypothetical protein
MMKRAPRAVLALLLGSSSLLTACDEDFESPAELDSLRVLAVRSEPASGVPGADAALEMLLVDEDEPPELAPERELDVLWLGGCHNPPGRQFYECYPLLRAIAGELEDSAVATPPERFPPGVFGTDRTFSFSVPDGILTDAPRIATDPVHFGVSFVFFAACSGKLRPRPELQNRVPIDCVDRESGKPVPPSELVTGFSTLYSYEGSVNENPRIRGVSIDGASYTPGTACEADADCGALEDGALRYACSSAQLCVPWFAACPADGKCPEHRILPDVDRASSERLGDENEIVWANYYTTAGSFEADTQLVADRKTGYTEDPSGRWHPPRRALVAARLWITLNDYRGGATWTSIDVMVGSTASEP